VPRAGHLSGYASADHAASTASRMHKVVTEGTCAELSHVAGRRRDNSDWFAISDTLISASAARVDGGRATARDRASAPAQPQGDPGDLCAASRFDGALTRDMR